MNAGPLTGSRRHLAGVSSYLADAFLPAARVDTGEEHWGPYPTREQALAFAKSVRDEANDYAEAGLRTVRADG